MRQKGCSVQIIYGRSGAGKTAFLCNELIRRSLSDSGQNYYMIVPEQSTMAMQKRLAAMHPDGGVMDIDILSFVRLTYRVFEELHVKTDRVLEDVGKTMVISHLLEQHREELEIFGRSAKHSGFHEEMKSMICELFQYGIHREDVIRTMETLKKDSLLHMKLKDLLLVFDSFEQYISGHYIVAEQLLELASDYVEQSEKLRGAVMYFDGFTGFTPVQYVLLDRLMSAASEIRISVTMPAPQSSFAQEHHLFHMGYEMLKKVTEIAKKHSGVVLLEPLGIEAGEKSRHASSEELSHLEQNLFVFPYKKWKGEPVDIQAFCTRTARDELLQVARRIRGLVEEEGYRYRDIAIVSGDLAGVAYLVEDILPGYGIPYFIDETVDMRRNPFVSWILSLWRIIAFDFQPEDVIAYIKNGYSDAVCADKAGLFENYALARNLKSRKGWELTASDQNMEELRRSFMEEIDCFCSLLEDKSVTGILTAIYSFSVSLHLEEKLKAQADWFAEQENHSQAGIYSQIYPRMMALFDKIADILGKERLSDREFYTILETGVQSLDIGMIPQGLDQVTVGDITRSRLENMKALFFININEGVIPRENGRGRILSDSDREQLQTELELAPGEKKRRYQEQFYLYLMLTKPSRRLFLSYHKLQPDNKTVRPSYLISRICTVFPELTVMDETEVLRSDRIYTREEGMKLLASLLEEYSSGGGEAEVHTEREQLLYSLLQIFHSSPEEEMLIKGLMYPVKEQDLPPELIRELYGSSISASISRLEQYAGCAFAFFLQYGLKLRERRLFKINAADTGDILHKTMELVFSYFKKHQGIRHVSFGECAAKTREVLAEIVNSEDYAEIFTSSERKGYLHSILERVAVNSVCVLKQQLMAGLMEPEAFELPFGGERNTYASFQLSGDVAMHLRGIVDRVDILADEESNKLYVQVIDYKSGHKHLDYTKLFYGTQLQLVVYMNIVRAWAAERYPGMQIVPVGMYYFHMQAPMVTVDLGKAADKEQRSEMRLAGLTVADSHIVSLVDNGPGEVVEVGIKKDGEFTGSSKVAPEEYFDAICRFAYDKVFELGQAMYQGKISVNPYKLGSATACDYCKFAGICLFDSTCPGQQYRYFAKKEKEVFYRDELDRGPEKSN